MIALEVPAASAFDLYGEARQTLAGKRVALIAAAAADMHELAEVIAEAEGFTRRLAPLQIEPGSDVLKPFELILVDVEAAAATVWLEPGKLAAVGERAIAVGSLSALLRLAADPALAFREYWSRSAQPEELLLRCVLALRPGSAASRLSARPGSVHSDPLNSTVVLADDDASVTAIVRRALERNGLQCELATTGRDALALIARIKPCAAILDVHMPTIDGFEVLSQMKRSAELAATRVILLTGCEEEADIVRGFSLGADDYVCKPFNPMELTIRLMRVIGRI